MRVGGGGSVQILDDALGAGIPPLAPTTTTIALSHAQPPQPHPPPPTAISFFPSIPFSFSQPCGTTISPGRNLQALLHHTRHRGGRGTQCESERRRERQREGEHCTVQISALNIQGRDSACFFSFSHLFLAVPATPKKNNKKTERFDFLQDNRSLKKKGEIDREN